MPEAVNSTSTSPQTRHVDFGNLGDALSVTLQRLDGLTHMLGCYLEENGRAASSDGVYYLFQQQVDDLRGVYSTFNDSVAAANAAFGRLDRDVAHLKQRNEHWEKDAESRIGLSLAVKLRKMVTRVWAEEQGRPVSDDDKKAIADLTVSISQRIYEQVTSRSDALEIGSHLQWAEQEIRAEIAGKGEPEQKSSPIAIRDQMIAQMVADGTPAAEVSQTFNLKRDTIDRIVGRLVAKTDAVSDNVRAKIERAADEEQAAS